MDAPERKAHLSDLFKVGRDITVTDENGTEYELFVRRPSSAQQDEARTAANAAMIRAKTQYDDKKSDAYISLKQTFSESEKDELIDFMVRYVESERQQQAFNEVLFGEEGTDWQVEDKYLSLVRALADRWEEIERYNGEMEAAGSDDRIVPEDDESLQALIDQQDTFSKEVEEIKEQLAEDERQKHVNKPLAQLINELVKMAIETESKLSWYEQYQTRMLYAAVRYPEDHERLYFESASDVLELPTYIRAELFEAYEDIDKGSEEAKNLLSLPNSSPSSEQ